MNELEALADAEQFSAPGGWPVEWLDHKKLVDALCVIVFDPKIRAALDPKALEQAREALGLS